MGSKIKNGLALLKCWGEYLQRGRANKSAPLRRILIVQNAKLGDMVCTTPLFRAIKEKYPACEVWVLGNAIHKELLAGNKDVDQYVVYEHQRDVSALIDEVRSWHVDAACLTAPEHRLLSILYLAGIPLIVTPKIEGGHSPYETLAYKLMRRIAVTIPHHFGSYAPREYLRLLEPLGIVSENTKKHLAFSSEAVQKAEGFLKHHSIESGKDFVVGISPSAGNKIKTWPAERFAEVASYAAKKYGAKIVVTGSKRDEQEVANMLKYATEPLINACGQFSLDELKAAIATMNMFIAVDTGPIYIAEAFDVPTIDIVGPMDEQEQPPISATHRVVVAKRSAPQLHIMNARMYNKAEARRQVEAISAGMVIKEFDSLMEKLRP